MKNAKSAIPAVGKLRRNFVGRELLTPREFEVVTGIVHALSNRQMGEHFGISPRTIEVHRERIFEKLRFNGCNSAVRLTRLVYGLDRSRKKTSPAA